MIVAVVIASAEATAEEGKTILDYWAAQVAAVMAILGGAGWFFTKVVMPIVKTIDTASDAYKSLLEVDSKQADVLRTVERMATESAQRHSGIERRVERLEDVVDVIRKVVGTRHPDDAPDQDSNTSPPASG